MVQYINALAFYVQISLIFGLDSDFTILSTTTPLSSDSYEYMLLLFIIYLMYLCYWASPLSKKSRFSGDYISQAYILMADAKYALLNKFCLVWICDENKQTYRKPIWNA